MTFGPHHYVPVLKVKRGEKAALRALAPALRPRITPLLEIVERKADKAPTVEGHLDNAFKDLAASAALFPRVFLDAREIADDGPPAALQVFQRAHAAGMVFSPVTGLQRTADLGAALAHRGHGLALRVTRQEAEAGGLPAAITKFLAQHKLAINEVDLVVDLGPVDDMVSAGVMALMDACLSQIPNLPGWRTVTVSGCAFPQSMGVVETQSHLTMERAEWVAWRDGLHATRGTRARLPTYSDCAIQHPSGVEDFDFRYMQVSAAVRYTLDEEWLLIKGESTKKTLPSEQFPKLATRLVYGHLHGQFHGVGHCTGCALMKSAADGAPGLGSAEAWRRLGTIHHITKVMEGLSTLPWP